MKLQLNALCLALLGGAASLLAPVEAQAGNVGHFSACTGGSAATLITLAGHTPVSVATLDNASLAPLDGLVISQCGAPYAGSSAVDAAVANGLRVLIDTQSVPPASDLPGDPALTYDGAGMCASGLSITPGAAITSGPGGTLTDSSLDQTSICSSMGSALVSSLPAGGRSFVEVAGNPGSSIAFAYPSGNGWVAVSFSQWMFTLPGGGYESDSIAPGAYTYYANTIAWMMGEILPVTTCASEGYTGTKLEWCKNICERGYAGSTLAMWIRR
ncbi:MAG TPA: hypothetical protein PK818_08985, partial [Thermomonas sp.]|nr:hypothetical protein [Thermomonas sp.]